MNSEWPDITFGEFVALQRGHDLPDQDRRPGTVPILGSFGITGFHDTVKVTGPGVTIGRSGASFGVAVYTDNDYWPLNTALYVTDFKGNVPRFVFYFFKQFDFSAYNSGSAQPSLNRNNLYGIHIQIPKPATQQGIADLLTALDDRIALLRETNATLEAIAQALFKSWFVDFDPVRAKQQGLAPEGMDEATAGLFPDGFEDSELGLVPKGWIVGSLSDIVVTSRKQLQPSDLHVALKYVGLEHIPRKSLGLTTWDTAEGLESAKAAFSEGDILFGKLRPYFHKVVVAPFDGVCSTDVLVCQPRQPDYHVVATMLLSSVALVEYADRLSNGAKMPRVTWKDLAAYPIIKPPQSVAAQYNRVGLPILEKIKANVLRAQTLTTLRDTLLPRLISGQLRLPEAQEQIEEAIA